MCKFRSGLKQQNNLKPSTLHSDLSSTAKESVTDNSASLKHKFWSHKRPRQYEEPNKRANSIVTAVPESVNQKIVAAKTIENADSSGSEMNVTLTTTVKRQPVNEPSNATEKSNLLKPRTKEAHRDLCGGPAKYNDVEYQTLYGLDDWNSQIDGFDSFVRPNVTSKSPSKDLKTAVELKE
ncbi:hypothetical protein M3Y95_00323800 [Aphelenchoides besseyi]|nr:hypothetical protein M3Y95_00323800 [Aphelenchoides besseyi]